ncbi:2-keto-4-pentenoate hydratase [Sphingopyxis sp. BSNA05]|uniref:2-keto-4-pentenoate hydratase n=1 Tax=Sphingopyxis sp. BSNA05 TaxID=1236614 RepID=UPI0015644A7C|nr:2-keto-4-pentenoate hydratase [Sphingopyxis sp. BSNA05]NRD89189.1 2-keto-4-pentenoate hydratase [Sphingopyxis sp. BSNA05]
MQENLGHQSIAEAFVDARKTASAFHSYPGEIPQSMDEGYAIQDIAIALDGRQIGGWKVGRVPPDRVEKFAAERLSGPIFVDEITDAANGDIPEMPIYGDGFAAAEAEVLLRLGSVPQEECDIDTVTRYIDDVRVGIEIASSPFSQINGYGPAVTVSDFGNNKGIVLGPSIAEWRDADLLTMPVSLQIDGETVGSNNMADMLDGPFGSVVFLLNLLRKRNIAITPGIWVSAGAITGVHDVESGQTVKAGFGDNLEASCKLVAI